jgi:hypothetical protein
VFDLFRFSLHEQNNRSPPCADIERFVGCVQN